MDEAYRRVDNYLAALGVERAITRHDAARQVVGRVAVAMQDKPERHPVEAAMEELRNEVMSWTGQFPEIADTEKFLQARLALLLAETPDPCRAGLFTERPVPLAGRCERLQPVPRFCPGRIDVQRLQLGLVPQLAEAALTKLEGAPWLRSSLAVAFFGCVFGLLFYFTR